MSIFLSSLLNDFVDLGFTFSLSTSNKLMSFVSKDLMSFLSTLRFFKGLLEFSMISVIKSLLLCSNSL